MTIPRNPDEARPDEATLLERLRAGEDAAYEELVRLYGPRLLAVARRFLRSEDDAQDAVQDAFLNAFRSIDSFEGQARISTWLHRIVVNASLMKLRTRRRKPEQSIEELLPNFLEDGHMTNLAAPWRKAGEDEVEIAQLRGLLLQKAQQLPDSFRNVLLLRDIEGLDTEEAAQLLEISTAAVKTRLHRARLALRELLDPHLRRVAE
ncbi:MAG: sigma-70 family RNA polymerase sigma factor [Myxococcales bacterium]|nr:sigma-70 family RNA polymerase sigma factor [Myxococcales bacterium]